MLLYFYKREHLHKLGKYNCRPSFRSCRHQWMLFHNPINIDSPAGGLSPLWKVHV